MFANSILPSSSEITCEKVRRIKVLYTSFGKFCEKSAAKILARREIASKHLHLFDFYIMQAVLSHQAAAIALDDNIARIAHAHAR